MGPRGSIWQCYPCTGISWYRCFLMQSDDLAWAKLLKRHPSNNLPPFDSDIPNSLTTDNQDVVRALLGFPRGSSPGGSGLRAQHRLLDTICGYSAPATQDCLHALTVLINLLLSGKAQQPCERMTLVYVPLLLAKSFVVWPAGFVVLP